MEELKESNNDQNASIDDVIALAASMDLSNLQFEPQRLLQESNRYNSELENLIMENYRIFVDHLACSVNLRTEDHKINDYTVELSSKLKNLNQQCSAFKDRVHHFVDYHKRNRKTLLHHMSLVELLEIPQLVDACSKNGFYEEALELANFVNKLEKRHLLATEVRSSNGSPRGGSNVVQTIVNDVHSTLINLRSQLLQNLTENVSLPKELSLLASLRRLDSLFIDRQLALEYHNNETFMALNESQQVEIRQYFINAAESRLQMDFLDARTIWLRTLTEASIRNLSQESGSSADFEHGLNTTTSSEPSSRRSSPRASNKVKQADKPLGPYGLAIELLEISRTAWFSIASQFHALFIPSVEEATRDVEGKTSNGSNSVTTSFPASRILGTWMMKQVHQFLHEFEVLLPQIEEGTSLRTVMEQALHFANRMGQVGCDFSGLLLPLFRKILVERLGKGFNVAISQFKVMIATEKVFVTIDDVSKEQSVPLFVQQDATVNKDSSSTVNMIRPNNTSNVDDIKSPSVLLRYPPLAYFLNMILQTLNLLRECPMNIIRSEVLSALEITTNELCRIIVENATDIKRRGGRYLTRKSFHSKDVKDSSNNDNESIDPIKSMDILYGDCVAKELLPHVFSCFDCIYDTMNSTISVNSGADNQTRFTLQSLADAKLRYSNDTLKVVTSCWNTLDDAQLIVHASKVEAGNKFDQLSVGESPIPKASISSISYRKKD